MKGTLLFDVRERVSDYGSIDMIDATSNIAPSLVLAHLEPSEDPQAPPEMKPPETRALEFDTPSTVP